MKVIYKENLMKVIYKENLMKVNPPYIIFTDKPGFTPTYSPREMLFYGVFAGAYFSQGLNQIPKKIQYKLFHEIGENKYIRSQPNRNINMFGVISGIPYIEWKSKGWIHPDDPNGWFEWYIKFYYGRRHEDDDRQIARFRAVVSRHHGMLRSLVMKNMVVKDYCKGMIGLHGERVSPTICQCLLQWGWDFNINPNFR